MWANNSTPDNSTIEDRNHFGLGVEGFFGMANRPYLFGIGVDYNFLRQLTDKDELNNTNTSGKMLNASLALGIESKRFVLLAKYFFYSQMTLDQQTTEGFEQVYQSPTASYDIQLHIKTGESSFWGINYMEMTYSELVENSREFSLPTNLEVNYSTIGIMYGLHY